MRWIIYLTLAGIVLTSPETQDAVLLQVERNQTDKGVGVTITCLLPKQKSFNIESTFELYRDGVLFESKSTWGLKEAKFPIQTNTKSEESYMCVLKLGKSYIKKSAPVILKSNDSAGKQSALFITAGVILFLMSVAGGIVTFLIRKKNNETNRDCSALNDAPQDASVIYSEVKLKKCTTSEMAKQEDCNMVYSKITLKSKTCTVPLQSENAEIHTEERLC
ncbi:uncharacterized protein LOC120536371 [Polypterus senegalus]|uniref:uncharacterized protein LOC120536371 n=1 Tax=Polypterus senegalus TaxID=55291 RepID=UPI0019631331|nr:uncharacterized protein LOC120536371 [Polypterus senegalus]